MVDKIEVSDDQSYPTGTIKGRYTTCYAERQPFLERAREAAEITIPSLLPREGHTGANFFSQPFQSVGARGVNNLASKLLLALLPPNSPFFRLTIDDFDLQNLVGPNQRGAVEEGFPRAMESFGYGSLFGGGFRALGSMPGFGKVLSADQIGANGRPILSKLQAGQKVDLAMKASIGAIAKGATIIEKHVTLNNNMIGPDHKASYNIKDFIRFVKKIREFEIILGNSKKVISKEENKIKLMARKSIVSKRQITKGEILKRRDLCFKRPGTGFSPIELNKVLGKKVKKQIGSNRVISKKHI